LTRVARLAMHLPGITRRTALALVLPSVAAAALTLAGPAGAQSRPTLTTGSAARVTPTTATLTGLVDPNGLRTTYFFEYGPTVRYGTRTAVQPAGSGTARVTALADVAGLTPATRYHFRLVATNRRGTTRGRDRTFATLRQPLALTLSATPNPVRFGGALILQGTLSGTGSQRRQVVVQADNFPYEGAFIQVGSPVVTDMNGNFLVGLPASGINTQFRAQTLGRQVVVSQPVTVGVRLLVRTMMRRARTRTRRGRLVRLSGVVTPARNGTPFAVQKLRRGRWVTVTGGVLQPDSTTTSRYTKRMRLRRGGRFRIFVAAPDGAYLPTVGRTVLVRVR
jgi:hypothetical protein